MWQNTIDFCNLFWYLANLLNFLISSTLISASLILVLLFLPLFRPIITEADVVPPGWSLEAASPLPPHPVMLHQPPPRTSVA